MSEEIGLTNLSLTPEKKYYGRWGNFGSRQVQSYSATFDGTLDQLTLQESEVAEVKWFTKDEIKQLHNEHSEQIPLYEIYQYFGFLD